MDFRQLRYFVAIVDCGSLSKAAEQVYVAQPALSQQIAALESELDTQLLLRSSRGVKPTEAGKVLYRHARTMLRQMDQVRREVSEPSSAESGTVALGLPNTVVSVLGLPLLKRVRAERPGIRLHLFESLSGYIEEFLAQGRLDMAVLFRDAETRGLAVQPLLEEDLFLIGNPPAATGASEVCPMADLDGVPMTLPSTAPTSSSLRLLIERRFAQLSLELNVIADIDSFPTNIAVARDGFACTILPYSAVVSLPPRERPPTRLLVEPGICRPLSLVWSTSLPRTPATLAVQRVIVGLVGEMVRNGEWAGVRLPSARSKPARKPK
jgi:LysR family transcriptional regulator, nitrogen assimilation regulatory protein